LDQYQVKQYLAEAGHFRDYYKAKLFSNDGQNTQSKTSGKWPFIGIFESK